MKRRTLVPKIVAVLLAAGGAWPAAAQTVRYLTPSKYGAVAGESIALRVEQGGGLDLSPTAWPTDQVEWFMVRAAGTQENRRNPATGGGQADTLSVPLPHADVNLIGVDFKPVLTRMPGRALRKLLARLSSADAGAVPLNANVAVRRVESAKTLVRVLSTGGKPTHSATAQSKTGQAAEIRALADPTMTPVGSDLPIRVYAQGSKRAGVKVRVSSVTAGTTREIVTDPSGVALFRITHPGVWRVEFRHVERAEHDPDAEWVIYSGTLTFEAPGAGGEK